METKGKFEASYLLNYLIVGALVQLEAGQLQDQRMVRRRRGNPESILFVTISCNLLQPQILLQPLV